MEFLATGVWYYYRISNQIVWSMIHVSDDRHSGDAHVLEFPDGHVVLIDTGFDGSARRNLIPYLKRRGIDHVDQLIVTHAHMSHYGGIEPLLGHLQYVDRVHFNLPAEASCEEASRPADCSHEDVLRTRDLIQQSGASLHGLTTDELLYYSDEHDIILEVVFAHDRQDEPAAHTDILDTSALLRLSYGNTVVLFTSDVSHKVGERLVREHYFLKADIMTAPDHGMDRAASNDFLNTVDSDVLMVSSSAQDWQGRDAARMRQFVEDNNMRTYVTGLHGNIIVTLTHDGFTIDSHGESPAH